jgi:MinD-like ATPase involved in chromosome partitioning or flagellar assembly
VIQQFLRDVEWGALDYLIVDAPPGTGDEPLTAAQLIGDPTGAVIVTTPQQVAVADVRRCITFCHQIGLPVLGVVENMSGLVCPHCNMLIDLFKTGGGKAMAEELDVRFLGAIPLDPGVVQSGDSGAFLRSHANSATATAFQAIVAKIVEVEKHAEMCPSHVPQPEKCAPSACSSCGADCPSKKKQS